GQLGDGTTTNQPTPITVTDRFTVTVGGFVPTPLLDIESLAAGPAHSRAVQADDDSFFWGVKEIGQPGKTRKPTLPSRPALVSGSGGTVSARSISAGSSQTCARRADATVACWGSDLQPAAVAGFTRSLAVAAGPSHKCALRADGIVRCVGSNNLGQLGNGG